MLNFMVAMKLDSTEKAHAESNHSKLHQRYPSIHAGYMPGDLYNMNSAYGTEDELKQCITEMHNHNLLVC
jgi:glycosidase